MTGTPNLSVGYVAASQNQKEVTINAAFDQLDGAVNGSTVVDCTTGGTLVVTVAQYTKTGIIRLGGTPAGGFALRVPDTKRLFVVSNESGQDASLQSTGGGTSTVIPDGATAVMMNLGTDARPISITTGGGTSIAAASDAAIVSPADNDILVYDISVHKWKNRRARYVVSASAITGVLSDGQNLLFHPFAVPVTFPANFGSYLGWTSEAGGSANATASTVVNVDKAAAGSPHSFSTIGTITFAIGTTTPTFATSGGTPKSFAAGDIMRLQGQATADATFADFYSTLVGQET